nr:uncharacterized protein LOC111426594 [Onthophagus taurus]
MLVASPFIHPYEACPRVISEVRKTEDTNFKLNKDHQNRNRLSGELLVKYGKEQPWSPRKVCIRGGQLLVGCSNSNNCGDSGTSNNHNQEIKPTSLKIPLRRLSLSAGSLPNSLSLIRGQNIVVTLQTTTESSFDTWVKAIAIELIRQTPLEDIKYFDILTIQKCWGTKEDENANYNRIDDTIIKCLNKSKVQIKEPKTLLTQQKESVLPKITDFDKRHRRYLSPIPTSSSSIIHNNVTHEKLRIRSKSCNAVSRNSTEPKASDENSVEVLLKKCQNSENYVPVKEKLLLFETLCRLGRKVRSTEDVSQKLEGGGATKRAKSLHDLSFNSAPVKEICQYFETRSLKDDYDKDSTQHVNIKSNKFYRVLKT